MQFRMHQPRSSTQDEKFCVLRRVLHKRRVCLVYEGNATPGHSSTSSLLDREFEKLDIHHKDVCTGEMASFGSVLPQNRDLTQRK